MKITKKEVEEANLKFFKIKAKDYNKEEPSYKPENIRRVRKNIKKISTGRNGKLLDIGCGTGFILDISYPYFQKLYGIDLSSEMLNEVNLRGGKIKVFEGNTDKLPFKNNYFDVCTAHGFLHHLHNVKSTIKEAYRCLKKNGILYTDLDPNFYFYEHAGNFKSMNINNEIPKIEINNVKDVTYGYKIKELNSLKLVGEKTITISEYQKSIKKGFKEEEIVKMFHDVGFKDVQYFYEWYLGEAYVKHKISPKSDAIISKHLQRCLPLTRNLFKYVSVIARK